MPITQSTYSAPTSSIPIQGEYSYETVAASQTAQVLGASGATEDYLHLVTVVLTSATNTLTILDGATTVLSFTNLNAIGVHTFFVQARCVTNWKVTTGANTTVLAVGKFT